MADEPANRPKRIVKNPETFRERALKASEASERPDRTDGVKRLGRRVARPVSAGGSRLAQNKLFRWLGVPLRFIGRIFFPAYFRNSWLELRRVEWPSWKQSRRLTFAVLAFAIVFGVTIALVDYGLDKLFRNILLK